MRRRGFTLVEVLVVVAIIAMLAAILLPSLQRSRAQARAVVCLSNMRQLGVAVHMYAQSYQGRLITYGISEDTGRVDPERAWFLTMRREYGDRLVARCPDDRSIHWTEPVSVDESEFEPGEPVPANGFKRRVSYGVNDYVTGTLGEPYDHYNLLHRIKRPATTVVFVEMAEEGKFASADHIHASNWFSSPRRLAGEQMAFDRHMGRANYVFADAHAASHFFEQTYKIRGMRREGNRFVPEWEHNMYNPSIAH